MVKLSSFVIHTTSYIEFINITKEVEEHVSASGIKNGVVFVITGHTTSAITVNEALECLQSDMKNFLWKLVPEDGEYSHARMLHSYGTTAGNPTGHIRSMLTGNNTVIPLEDGKMIRGSAQEIFFCEFDGAQSRTVYIQVIGD